MMQYKTYLVGGAVRDRLLGLPVSERDWVVVGATPELLFAQGYHQVGKDFPVFLHPKTKEEYALARAERKIDKGYHGFEFTTETFITLEEDLLRRDLTINAIAQDEHGNYIDPYNGISDIKNRVLRHVSPAFIEDPVRVLRLARFYARFKPFGFTIAPETKALVQQMIHNGELQTLVPERIWLELRKALGGKNPDQFFVALRALNTLNILFPELNILFGIPQTARYHPEVDSGIHTLMTLEEVAQITDDLCTRFAMLCHDYGKGLTPPHEWPSHKGHETRGLSPINAFCDRLKVPNEYRNIALKVSEFHLHMHNITALKPKTLVKLILRLDAIRQPQNLFRFIDACEADARGRLGFRNRPYPQRKFLMSAYQALLALDISNIIEGVDREQIADKIHEARVQAISCLIKKQTDV